MSLLSYGVVAQLVRAPACHAGSRGFESHQSRLALVAQLVEQLSCKQQVVCSSQIGGFGIHCSNYNGRHRQEVFFLCCEISSVVERNLAKVDVIGSNPIFRSRGISSTVEHLLCKQGVIGSNPIFSIGLDNPPSLW